MTVNLLHYTFEFRSLTWREESPLEKGDKFPLALLSASLVSVKRGDDVFTPSSFQQGYDILKSLTSPVLGKVFMLYKSQQPKSRHFKTMGLYKAPNPQEYERKVEEEDQSRVGYSDEEMETMRKVEEQIFRTTT